MAFAAKKRKIDQLRGDFREIFVSANRELTAFGTVFVIHPENMETEHLGVLFGVIKIDDNSNDSSYVSNLLTSVFKKEYFSNPNRPADACFEAGLRKANLALAELARQGSVKWSGHINFAGGVLEKNNLHFSKLGSTSILLIRGNQIADIGAGMGVETNGKESHPLKTFSDISSGKIEKNDLLVFATGDLLDIFSMEEIRQHANRFSREEFSEFISVSLTDNSELASAIILSVITEQELEKKSIAKIPEKIVALPDEKHNLKEKAEQIIPETKKEFEEKIYPPKNHLFTSEKEKMPKRKGFAGKILLSSKKIFAMVGSGATSFYKRIGSSFAITDGQKKTSGIKYSFSAISRSFGRFGWMRDKISLRLIAIITAILLVVGSAYSLFRGKIPSAPSTESETPIATPPSILQDKQVKIIDNLSEIVQLSAGIHSASIIDNIPYLISDDNTIMSVDPTNSQTATYKSDLPLGKFSSMTAMPDLNTIFILTADKKMVAFNVLNKKFQENRISLPENLKITDMKTFLTYLYILDSDGNQIYRFPRAEGGFGDKQDWMKSGEDISSSTSFAINENLFVASRDQIIAFYQGKKDEKIVMEDTDVPLAIDKIYTEENFSNIYALDNKNHRVISFSTDGKIVSQYWNESINDVKDFSVDEKNNIIYLLMPDSVNKFSMD